MRLVTHEVIHQKYSLMAVSFMEFIGEFIHPWPRKHFHSKSYMIQYLSSHRFITVMSTYTINFWKLVCTFKPSILEFLK